MQKLFDELHQHPEQYQSVPFWSWNDQLDKDMLTEQIRWMKSQGIGGFFMHARGGLRTEYMSEDWMQCVDACVEEAKKQGMQAWIYDENGWPSGFAGGKLLEEQENLDTHITYKIGQYDANAWLTYSFFCMLDSFHSCWLPSHMVDSFGCSCTHSLPRVWWLFLRS